MIIRCITFLDIKPKFKIDYSNLIIDYSNLIINYTYLIIDYSNFIIDYTILFLFIPFII